MCNWFAAMGEPVMDGTPQFRDPGHQPEGDPHSRRLLLWENGRESCGFPSGRRSPAGIYSLNCKFPQTSREIGQGLRMWLARGSPVSEMHKRNVAVLPCPVGIPQTAGPRIWDPEKSQPSIAILVSQRNVQDKNHPWFPNAGAMHFYRG